MSRSSLQRGFCPCHTWRICRPWQSQKLAFNHSPTSFAARHAFQRRPYTAAPGAVTTGPAQTRSTFRRLLTLTALSVFFTSTGFIIAVAPAIPTINTMITPPTDAETLALFQPTDDLSIQIENFVNNHPLALQLRANPDFSESRPHMKIPEASRHHNLTGGTLSGPRKIVVPPISWSEKGGKSLVSIFYLGTDLCGHPGIIHGGLMATMLDEGLARCCFPALPNKIGMTANLNINYRKPAPAGSFVVLKAKTVKVEGRKAWVEGYIETLVGEGEQPVVLAEASALFVEPRKAASMAKIYSVT